MGYDRNERGFGREPYRSPSFGTRPDHERERERGYRGHTDRGGGQDHDRDRGYGRDAADDDRGFFDRAGDEVRSWFGDDEAERRREEDERRYERQYRAEGGDRGRGWRSDRGPGGGRVSGADYDAAYAASYGVGANLGVQGQRRSRHEHDPHYREWRDRQLESLDRDYDEYRRENQGRFESEFGSWRQNRQTQRDSLGTVREHQEVVGSDGQHIGTVDHVRGDRILLTKTDKDAGGHHHSIPSSWIRSVGEKVEVSKTADEAQRAWREERDEKERGGLFGNGDRDTGPTNLNRSFSGTY